MALQMQNLSQAISYNILCFQIIINFHIGVVLTKPNSGCDVECKLPLVNSKDYAAGTYSGWPNWPHC